MIDPPLPFLATLRADLEAHIPPGDRGGSRWDRARRGLAVAFRSPGFRVAILHRAGHAIRPRLGPIGRALASSMSWAIRHGYGCSIAPTARLEGGLILPHPMGIVVGPGVEVGPRAWIFQHATLGGSPGRPGMPRVGPDARIYPGAVLAGPIVVGSGVVVGANAVVTFDVPDHATVRAPSPTITISPPAAGL